MLSEIIDQIQAQIQWQTSRIEIDRPLLEKGYKADDIEMAWLELTIVAPKKSFGQSFGKRNKLWLLGLLFVWLVIVFTWGVTWPYVQNLLSTILITLVFCIIVFWQLSGLKLDKIIGIIKVWPLSTLTTIIVLLAICIIMAAYLVWPHYNVKDELKVKDVQYYLIEENELFFSYVLIVYRCEFFNLYCPAVDRILISSDGNRRDRLEWHKAKLQIEPTNEEIALTIGGLVVYRVGSEGK